MPDIERLTQLPDIDPETPIPDDHVRLFAIADSTTYILRTNTDEFRIESDSGAFDRLLTEGEVREAIDPDRAGFKLVNLSFDSRSEFDAFRERLAQLELDKYEPVEEAAIQDEVDVQNFVEVADAWLNEGKPKEASTVYTYLLSTPIVQQSVGMESEILSKLRVSQGNQPDMIEYPYE